MASIIPRDTHMPVELKNEMYCWKFRRVELRRKTQNNAGWKGLLSDFLNVSGSTLLP